MAGGILYLVHLLGREVLQLKVWRSQQLLLLLRRLLAGLLAGRRLPRLLLLCLLSAPCCRQAWLVHMPSPACRHAALLHLALTWGSPVQAGRQQQRRRQPWRRRVASVCACQLEPVCV